MKDFDDLRRIRQFNPNLIRWESLTDILESRGIASQLDANWLNQQMEKSWASHTKRNKACQQTRLNCYFLRFKSRHSHLFSTLSYMSFVAVSVESSSPYGAARFAVGPYGEEDSTSRRWKALEAPHLGGREWGGRTVY